MSTKPPKDRQPGITAEARLEQEFSAHCLPRTMKAARLVRSQVAKRTQSLPKRWPFEDHVLAYLLPRFRADVERFHSAGGPGMAELFQPHQLEHLDQDLEMMLRRKLAAAEKADRDNAEHITKMLLAAVDRLAEALVSIELRLTDVEKRLASGEGDDGADPPQAV